MKVSKVEKVLELLNRVHKVDRGFRVFLHTEFVDSMLWKDMDLWMELYANLCSKKSKETKKTKGGNFMGILTNVQKLIGANKEEDKLETVR